MSEQNPATKPPLKSALKNLSTQDFKTFGLNQIGYIKRVDNDNKTIYAIHAADGKQIDSANSHELAVFTARQNDVEPMTVQ
ncbi:MAG: DUF1150 family protein [Alphaproteobacteria bacterium]